MLRLCGRSLELSHTRRVCVAQISLVKSDPLIQLVLITGGSAVTDSLTDSTDEFAPINKSIVCVVPAQWISHLAKRRGSESHAREQRGTCDAKDEARKRSLQSEKEARGRGGGFVKIERAELERKDLLCAQRYTIIERPAETGEKRSKGVSYNVLLPPWLLRAVREKRVVHNETLTRGQARHLGGEACAVQGRPRLVATCRCVWRMDSQWHEVEVGAD